MNDFPRRVAKSIGCHFVTLSCVQKPLDGPKKALVFSGFIIEVAGKWFYITAGHILGGIRAALKAGSTFDIWRLDDQTAGNRFNGNAIPYNFEVEDWLVLEDAQLGIDYAAVHIVGLIRQQLEAGGVMAIASNAWSDHLTEHDYWVLVGIPSESVSYDGETNIAARFVWLYLISDDAPTTAGKETQNLFYARLAEDSEQFVKDIDGMSGGPIFNLKEVEGIWKYNIIGVQSAWYPSTRVLAICPFSSFGIALEEVLEDAS